MFNSFFVKKQSEIFDQSKNIYLTDYLLNKGILCNLYKRFALITLEK